MQKKNPFDKIVRRFGKDFIKLINEIKKGFNESIGYNPVETAHHHREEIQNYIYSSHHKNSRINAKLQNGYRMGVITQWGEHQLTFNKKDVDIVLKLSDTEVKILMSLLNSHFGVEE